MARLTSRNNRRSIPKALTGITGLDEITGGGLPTGRSTLVRRLPPPVKKIIGDQSEAERALGFGFTAGWGVRW